MKLETTLSLGLFAAVALLPTLLAAQPSSGDKVAATQLFDDAEELMAAGNAAAACPRYGESQRRDPQLGTLLHLADCYEKVGKSASAWAAFKEAVEIAARKNAAGDSEPRERTARARAAALVSKLSWLTIKVTGAEVPGLEIRQAGEVVGRAVWGSAVPVDPASYPVSASAPGRKTWTSVIKVGPRGADVEITIPALEAERVASATLRSEAPQQIPAPTLARPLVGPAESGSDGNAQRATGFVVASVGAIGIGVGTAFGLMSNGKVRERDGICPTEPCPQEEADRIHELTRQAQSDAIVFNVALGVGASVFVGGVVLLLTAPSSGATTSTALRLETWGGTQSMGARLNARW